jgi:hypothetical protein
MEHMNDITKRIMAAAWNFADYSENGPDPVAVSVLVNRIRKGTLRRGERYMARIERMIERA